MPSYEDQIFEQVQEIITNHLSIEKEKVLRNTNFTKDLKADSLDVVELIMLFEEQFDIEIEDEQAGKLATVMDVVQYIIDNE